MNTNVFITYAVAEIKALKTKRYEAVKKTNKNQAYAMANCNQDTNNLQYQNLINVK